MSGHQTKLTPTHTTLTYNGFDRKTRWKTHLMDLRRSCQQCYNHVWTRLDKSGPVWMSLDQSGQVWTSLNQSGPVWTSLDQSGQVWTNLDNSGRVWTTLDKSGQVWTSLDKFEEDMIWWNTMEQFLTWLPCSVCFFYGLLDNGWRRRRGRRRRRKTTCRPAGFAAGKNDTRSSRNLQKSLFCGTMNTYRN